MQYGKNRTERRLHRGLQDSTVLLLLLLLGFYVNRHIHIKGLYMDDLYMWSCYGEQSYLEFAFPFRSSTRFRPVYWTLTYLEMMIVRNHPSLFVPVNILLNVGLAFFLYRFSRRLSGQSLLSGLMTGALYLISHFAYYQIAQALGLLETMSLFLAVLLLFLLLRYLREGRNADFLAACLCYFLLVFSHERYLALFPLFYLALFGGGEGKESRTSAVLPGRSRARGQNGRRAAMERAPQRFAVLGFGRRCFLPILPLLELFGIILLRRFFIGSALPAGTGGTEVTETFSIRQALHFSVQQLLYLFGINVGPEYLAGISWTDVAPGIRRLVFLSWLPLSGIVLAYLFWSVRRRAWRERHFLAENLLFLGFLALCIGCSAVTIRVELRWVYVSYAGALLYLSYMIGRLGDFLGAAQSKLRYRCIAAKDSEKVLPLDRERAKRDFGERLGRRAVLFFSVFFLLYGMLIAPVERYYRSFYSRIYFWEDQDRMNSLAEETVEKYGIDGVLGKQVYIIENSYRMTEFYGRTFFKVYDPEKTGQGTVIRFLPSLAALPASANAENSIVLRELPEARGYRDITAEVF